MKILINLDRAIELGIVEIVGTQPDSTETQLGNASVTLGNKKPRFEPPTIDAVVDYCVTRGNTVDPNGFMDFYESKGWMIGKNKMKDWKAAVRTWEKSNGNKRQESKSAVDRVRAANPGGRDTIDASTYRTPLDTDG